MQKLTKAELAAETVELLPGRETLFWDQNVAGILASNASYAVNAATVLSAANSVALQGVSVTQF
ncbi:hypothetical protein [Sinomonas terrae]|jgi:hypothetical protein|uniref:Uncharacterized protein n=1 Tax=Sinomonas terrae TaxID=2908838 RepID=A0ABS9U6S2_9MICC|nr:hypothetical protein [Sinomonas terrae]MCH6472062.1 hypothetical protein [Sinomonas terrae]HKU11072.1 hypothetical protein [Sinomonas sp.]